MIATATYEPCSPSHQKRLTVVVDVESSVQAALADHIYHLRESPSVTECNMVSTSDLAAVTCLRDHVVVFLFELERSFLYSLEE